MVRRIRIKRAGVSRHTKQVRIDFRLHRTLRKIAFDRGVTLSNLIDQICLEHLDTNNLDVNDI